MSDYPVIPATNRATEHEVAQALMGFLPTCAYGSADMRTITFNLPGRWIRLSKQDKEVSRSRDNEQKWHHELRNIGAHFKAPGNAIHDGLLVKRRGGGYQLASRVKKQEGTNERRSPEKAGHPQRDGA